MRGNESLNFLLREVLTIPRRISVLVYELIEGKQLTAGGLDH